MVSLHHMANQALRVTGLSAGQRSRPFLRVVIHGWLTRTQTHKYKSHTYTQRETPGRPWRRRAAAAAGCWRWVSSACTVNMKRGTDPLHPLSLVQFLLFCSLRTDPSLAQPLLARRIALQSTEQVIVRDIYVGRHRATGGEEREIERSDTSETLINILCYYFCFVFLFILMMPFIFLNRFHFLQWKTVD